MVPVRRMGHTTFETHDIERSIAYYTDVLGLTLLAREAGRAFLAAPGDHHSVILKAGHGAGCTRLALQVAADADLDGLVHHMAAHGLTPERRSDAEPGIADIVSVTDPAGLHVDIFRMRTATSRARQVEGIVPRKLGHTAFFADDVQRQAKWYGDVLGFRVSDWIGDFFVFLRCGPDHHTVNFLRGPSGQMHHIAFELNDWNHVKQACDHLNRHAVKLIWGPGRHGPGHNIYTYHKNADDITVEMFCELDTMSDETLGAFEPRPWHRDCPQRPKIWPPGVDTTNFWGIPRPEFV
jgi:catechol 2,3-dioxygenase-like lactoylglutathione lyase family enzyme